MDVEPKETMAAELCDDSIRWSGGATVLPSKGNKWTKTGRRVSNSIQPAIRLGTRVERIEWRFAEISGLNSPMTDVSSVVNGNIRRLQELAVDPGQVTPGG